MQTRKRKVSRKAKTRATTRLRIVKLNHRVKNMLNSSLVSSSSTDEIENQHGNMNNYWDNNKLEIIETQPGNENECTTVEIQESSSCRSNISDENSNGNSRRGSSDEYESNFSEYIDICEAVDTETLRALRDDNEERNAYIIHELKKWAMKGVSCKKIDALLRVLQIVFPILPKTYRSLLQTERSTNLMEMGNGTFWYKGILSSVISRLSDKYLFNRESVQFDINIDGLELYRSSRQTFWPILGCLVDEKEPFIIAVYHGEGKPPLEPFLRQFVNELYILMTNGIIFKNTTYRIEVRNFVLDAPARAFIKCIRGHTSKKACEKCHVIGVRYKNREVFLDHDACLRNDEEFRYKVDAGHHIPGITSPLEEIGIGMVSQFRLDEMHLLYIGVFQRWLEFVLGKRGPK